jgi:hypothetical protein
MTISKKIRALCLEVAKGDLEVGNLLEIKTELMGHYPKSEVDSFCLSLLASAIMAKYPNRKDILNHELDTWYSAKNRLIRHVARYSTMKEANSCPLHQAMKSARDNVNLI